VWRPDQGKFCVSMQWDLDAMEVEGVGHDIAQTVIISPDVQVMMGGGDWISQLAPDTLSLLQHERTLVIWTPHEGYDWTLVPAVGYSNGLERLTGECRDADIRKVIIMGSTSNFSRVVPPGNISVVDDWMSIGRLLKK